MEEEELYQLKSYIERSKNRKKILDLLANKNEPMTPSQIAEELEVHRTTISKRVVDMADKDLVKVLNPEDNRNRYYTLTEKGSELIDVI
jgi:DNA-binding MarR family transcriptional regulator